MAKKKRGRPRKKREYNSVDTVTPDAITRCVRCHGGTFMVLRTVEQSLGNGKFVTYRYRKCISTVASTGLECGQVQRQPVMT